MIKKRITKQERINQAMKIVDNSYKLTPFDARLNVHNTLEHEMAKTKVLYLLKKEKKLAFAEVIFKNGSRADIFVPEDFLVIEILHSETLNKAIKKKDYYPKEVDITFLTTKDLEGVNNFLF